MKKSQRKWIVITLLAAMLLAVFSCARDEYEHPQDPECMPELLDELYEGPFRMVLGFGHGAIAAARIRGEFPDRFALAAGLGGPMGLKGLLAQQEAFLVDFDNWPETPSRFERLVFIEELFYSFGNPLYDNPDSGYFPPGTQRSDFEADSFTPKTVNGIIDRLNPDGSLPAVTFEDESGRPVSFALALDQNQNGRRDLGEPVIMQIHEDYTDQNGNGVYDEGEPFEDNGIDGVAGTFDKGEANEQFDYSPNGRRFADVDLTSITPTLLPEQEANYLGAVYTDLGASNQWDFDYANDILFSQLGGITTGYTDIHCIEDLAAIYDEYLWDTPYPDLTPYIPERFIYMRTPGTGDQDLDPLDENFEFLRARRVLQALAFLAARTPNWFMQKKEKDESPVIYEKNSFETESGYRARYLVGLPESYYDKRTKWEEYPILYVLPDVGYNPDDWTDLLIWQGWLASRQYAPKTIIVILDPDGENYGTPGYSYFTGPADPDQGQADTAEIFEEIIAHVESKYRGRDY